MTSHRLFCLTILVTLFSAIICGPISDRSAISEEKLKDLKTHATNHLSAKATMPIIAKGSKLDDAPADAPAEGAAAAPADASSSSTDADHPDEPAEGSIESKANFWCVPSLAHDLGRTALCFRSIVCCSVFAV